MSAARFNQKIARGLDMLADVYATLAACAQGHCVGPDQSLDKLSPLLADWPAYERFDLLPDAVVELYARLGDGDKTLLALNNLLWLRESIQRQTLPPKAAAARLERKAEVGALSDAERKELDDLRTANAPSPAAAARAYPTSLPSMLSRLPDNITILAYYLGPGGLWICRRRGKSPTKVFPLQTRNEDLTAAAERFRRSLADQTADWEGLSSDLYKILLPGAGGPIPAGDLLLVVGSGALGAFPFEALGPSPGRLLAVTNPVVYLSTLDSGAQPQWRTAGSALVVGYNGTLARAEEEAGAIAKILHVDPVPPAKATWEELKPRLPGARLVHFASHASFDPTNPYESSLQLADGPLPVWQILDSSSKLELAVFSACQTRRGLHPGTTSGGLGPDLANMAGLAVAMGARWTIGLWKVNDEATLRLMKAFYGQFSPKVSPEFAMYEARQRFVSDRKGLAPPYLYTGFVVTARDLRSEVAVDEPRPPAPAVSSAPTAPARISADAAFATALHAPSSAAAHPVAEPSAPPPRAENDAVLQLILARHTAALNPNPESDLGLRLRYREIDAEKPVKVTAMSFYRDERPLLCTFSRIAESPLFDIRPSGVLLRDPRTGKTVRFVPVEKGTTHLTPDAKRIVTRSGDDFRVRVRDAESGTLLHDFDDYLGLALAEARRRRTCSTSAVVIIGNGRGAATCSETCSACATTA